MGLDKPEDEAAWDAAWEGNYYTAVPRGFALAAKVTGVRSRRTCSAARCSWGPS
ncbi:hypothetical protein ACQEVF_23065 [Nonomuraea polychroma]|uniref:hypothetical protein n=1 Tax=Nonomuraea polychroma TaxID=46176 RepID=UPI003D950A3D